MVKRLMIAYRGTVKEFKEYFKRIYIDPNQKIADGPYIEITRDFTVFRVKFKDKSLEIIVKTRPYISLN